MTGWIQAFKIVERQEHNIKTLFHGFPGNGRRTRSIPRDKWLRAERKWVKDGAGEVYYWSGFHVFMDRQTAEGYLRSRFKHTDNRFVQLCYVKNLRRKLNSDAWLAEDIYFPSGALVPPIPAPL